MRLDQISSKCMAESVSCTHNFFKSILSSIRSSKKMAVNFVKNLSAASVSKSAKHSNFSDKSVHPDCKICQFNFKYKLNSGFQVNN